MREDAESASVVVAGITRLAELEFVVMWEGGLLNSESAVMEGETTLELGVEVEDSDEGGGTDEGSTQRFELIVPLVWTSATHQAT